MVDWRERIERMRAALAAAGGAPTAPSWPMFADQPTQPMDILVSLEASEHEMNELDTLIADALEQRAKRERAAAVEAEAREREAREQRCEALREEVERVLFPYTRQLLGVTYHCDDLSDGAYAAFVVDGQQWRLTNRQYLGTYNGRQWAITSPDEGRHIVVGAESEAPFEETLLIALGDWKARQAEQATAQREAAEDAANIPF